MCENINVYKQALEQPYGQCYTLPNGECVGRGCVHDEHSLLYSAHPWGVELKQLTLEHLEATMDYGATRHEPGSWHAEGLEHHVEHAYNHILKWQQSHQQVDLEHAMTRMAMALYSHINNLQTPKDNK